MRPVRIRNVNLVSFTKNESRPIRGASRPGKFCVNAAAEIVRSILISIGAVFAQSSRFVPEERIGADRESDLRDKIFR